MNQGLSSAAILLLNMRLIAFPERKITRIKLKGRIKENDNNIKGQQQFSKATSN